MNRFIVGLLTLSSVVAFTAPVLSAPLDLVLYTGGDDLRGKSYANFYIKLRNRPLKKFTNVTQKQNLPNNSLTRYTIDVPELTSPNQLEYCEIEHVSQEDFGQTADNWNLDTSLVIMRIRNNFPVVLCETKQTHRFQGNTRRLTINPAR